HTRPVIGYLPAQPALDSFSRAFGNKLYLLEQRPAGDWSGATHFGLGSGFLSTEKLYEHLLRDPSVRVDQQAYIRARVLDILIGDWGRHEDQWRWALADTAGRQVYRPVPRDRDQAFTRFDGFLLNVLISAADLDHYQTFGHRIKNIKDFNFPARNIDRFLANEPTLSDWQQAARSVQAAVTDSLIDAAVRRLPPELYPLSGPDIAAKLKTRRNDLLRYAEQYYRYLAEEVDVTGTAGREHIQVDRLNDRETRIAFYRIGESGQREAQPFYRRVFLKQETDEVRLYGIDGEDVFRVEGSTEESIRVRLIGGPARDSILDYSSVSSGGRKTKVHDNRDNILVESRETDKELRNDPSVHRYQYGGFEYSKKGLRPAVFYSSADRLFAGIGYRVQRRQWRRSPYGYEHGIYLRYSVTQRAFNVFYEGVVTDAVGPWDLTLNAGYDAVRWSNFFGLGNETPLLTRERDFYRLRTAQGHLSAGLNQRLGRHHFFGITGFLQSVQVLSDTDRYVYKTHMVNGNRLDRAKTYSGARAQYVLRMVNDSLLPTRGIRLTTALTHT
ncbi:MAG TPA: hypothetical protein VHK69_17130, partial [Chitinophagaceae bacterium]|nr:hypothetical protein [Chitinophagaceae bacterium]